MGAEQMEIAQKESDAKFGKAQAKLAADKKHADLALGSAVNGLNDALAKQAALADSRFEKTVKDISAARKEAATEVSDLRKAFGSELARATAEAKRTKQILVDNIAKVSGEVISMKANQARVNAKVGVELKRIEGLANHRFSESKKARGKHRMLMDENKAAAAEEVKALTSDLKTKLAKLRKTNSDNRIEMAKDLSTATETFYEKMSAVQKENMKNIGELNGATAAAKLAAQNELARAQAMFDSKIVMLTNTVSANAKKAENGMARLTGVVHDIAKANAKDRDLIKEQAKAKAVEQRIAEHLKNTKRFLQVELNESVDKAA